MIHSMRDGDRTTTIHILVGVGFVVLTLVWWVLPLIRWRGKMSYDKLVGCEVRRT